jgi:hypothetical protein
MSRLGGGFGVGKAAATARCRGGGVRVAAEQRVAGFFLADRVARGCARQGKRRKR